MGIDLDVREESIFAALDGTWTPVSVLATKLGGGRAWRRPDGRQLDKESLRVIVHRCAAKLLARRFV